MFRRTLPVLAAAVGLAAAAAGPATADDVPADRLPGHRVLDVMTFNIHHAQGTDDVLDLRRVANVIRKSGADVVGLQEVDKHYSARSDWADQPAELAELLGYHVVFGANIDNSPPAPGGHRVQYGTAILSRYPITASDNTWLYKSPGQEQRGLLHATLDVHGRKVEFYNTHLAAGSQADRLQQTAQVVDLIGTRKPGVLVGDFNALPAAPESRPLQNAYTDAWAKSLHARGDGATYPAQSPTERIDLIYATRRVTPLVTQVLKDDPAASDHRPLLGKVLVKP
ncbi:metal-dependent hydrolase [Streptomyces anthocyanicus]|uniref:endonuclease/exonuclease/phosphatase family protein n=1 Tax=Streptomyces anthocyanicus TaxID=68174 RepID=UPI001874647B|nr:endonuclease/exonuclease/phosphatase family protein [Streptomyces anthocyanicus]GHB87631.1 metal-dependent hydrolase [Streptomyces anthocyanicus]